MLTLGDGWVKGYLFTLEQAAMAGLDNLEGYTPNRQDASQDEIDT